MKNTMKYKYYDDYYLLVCFFASAFVVIVKHPTSGIRICPKSKNLFVLSSVSNDQRQLSNASNFLYEEGSICLNFKMGKLATAKKQQRLQHLLVNFPES